MSPLLSSILATQPKLQSNELTIFELVEARAAWPKYQDLIDSLLFETVQLNSICLRSGWKHLGSGFIMYHDIHGDHIGFNPAHPDFSANNKLNRYIKSIKVGWADPGFMIKYEKSVAELINNMDNLESLETRFHLFGINKELKKLVLNIRHDFCLYPGERKSLYYYKTSKLQELEINWGCEKDTEPEVFKSYQYKNIATQMKMQKVAKCDLQFMACAGSALDNFTPFRYPKLCSLKLSNTLDKHDNIIDLHQLDRILPQLQVFSCGGSFIATETVWNQLHACEKLSISGNLKQIPAISKLSNLQELNLQNNKITILDYSKLPANLLRLDLSNNKIHKIKGHVFYNNLVELSLNSNNLKSIDKLSLLHCLQKLDLSNNHIRELKHLNSLGDIKKLSINYNPLKKIEGLCGLSNICNIQCLTDTSFYCSMLSH